eukprot:764690-Hanusia_phi.AAC.9
MTPAAGLPMKCSREDICDWLEDLSDRVNVGYNKPDGGTSRQPKVKTRFITYQSMSGFEGGIAIFKNEDGDVLGSCLAAMARLNGKLFGRGRMILIGAKKHFKAEHIRATDVEPEFLLNEEGLKSGEVILTFQDTQSAEETLATFDWKSHDQSFRDARMLTSLRYDEMKEEWVEIV